MACQVGITTDPERRKQEWQREHPNLRDWEIISRHYSKSAAQQREVEEARRRGCNHGVGGGGPETATWYVYRFTY